MVDRTSAVPAIRRDLRGRSAYSEGAGIYRIVPQGVAVPVSASEVTELVRGARDAGGIVPRGAGTGMAGGNVGEGLLLDLTRLTGGRVRIDPRQRTATASAGVSCARLLEEARSHGLRFPPTPSSWRWATLGGMAATNAAGARSFRFGPVRTWIQGLTLITADGTQLDLVRGHAPDWTVPAVRRLAGQVEPDLRAAAGRIRERFPRVRKNTAGYGLAAWLDSGDLIDLVVGSEGTLGIVTEVTVQLDPEPPWRGGLRVALADDAALTRTVALLGGSGASSLELLDRTFLQFVRHALPAEEAELAAAGAVLLLEFEGDRDQVRYAVRHWTERLRPDTLAVASADQPDGFDALWAIRHAASPLLARLDQSRRSLQVIEDGCVPRARLAEYLSAVRTITAEEGVPAVLFGHAGDGHLHVNLLADPELPAWWEPVRRIHRRVGEAVLALGGTPAGEHGTGRLRAGLLEPLYGPEITAFFRRIKQAFDPEGILNPGVVIPAPGADPLEHLKVGSKAAPLPEDIALALRDIERTGGYDQFRMELAGA